MDNNFKLPGVDLKKMSGKFMMIALLGALGLAFYVYILPFLLSLVWNTIQLVIGIVVGVVLFMIITNGKFWRGLQYMCEALASLVLGIAIEMNPWNIVRLKIEGAEKDRAELRRQSERLKAQEASLRLQIQENDGKMKLASGKVKIVNEKLQKSPNDEELGYQLEIATTEFTNAKEFIDQVQPIYNDVSKLSLFSDKAWRKSGVALENAKSKLIAKKAAYDAVSAGSSAMKKAMRAFTGKAELNSDAEKALAIINRDIAGNIGGIKDAISITSQLMTSQDLNDAAKVGLAAKAAGQFNVDTTFVYSQSLEGASTAGLDNKQITDATSRVNRFLQ